MRLQQLLATLPLLPTTFSIPTLPPLANTTTIPSHFGLLVFPGFQALDVFGPLDVLNLLSLLYPNTTMALSILSRTLDPVSTAIKGMHGASDFGESVVPTITLGDYLQRANSTETPAYAPPAAARNENTGRGDIQVLIVPGGMGTRVDVSEEIAFVKAVYPKLKYLISVCTGASILARSGILDGRRATTNKKSWAWVTSTGPNVNWVPTARWVEDGNIFSSSGVAAGIDATYAWVSRVYGDEVAHFVSLNSEYERETHWDNDPFAKVWEVPGAV
ncbi:hypothetical protein ACN47E_005880 [Coniothyrium glycines]